MRDDPTREPAQAVGESEAHVSHAYAIRRASEDGHTEYDFLAGSAQYKRQLALAERSLVTLRAVRPGIRERARVAGAGARRLARAIRGLYRRATE